MTEKICPLLSSTGAAVFDCLKERCAWWVEDDYEGGCAMAALASFVGCFVDSKLNPE